ncbi:hypothetical protein SDC9_189111 [bioreactor metagenome]|uniref:Uncharacterized protein n=1 Tax=bioreactor metagenome TaxID=1076179 RepID=A0A645HR77_9ZZZZ
MGYALEKLHRGHLLAVPRQQDFRRLDDAPRAAHGRTHRTPDAAGRQQRIIQPGHRPRFQRGQRRIDRGIAHGAPEFARNRPDALLVDRNRRGQRNSGEFAAPLRHRPHRASSGAQSVVERPGRIAQSARHSHSGNHHPPPVRHFTAIHSFVTIPSGQTSRITA